MSNNNETNEQKEKNIVLNALRMGASIEDIGALVGKSVREMETMQVPLPVLYEYTQAVAENCYSRGVKEGMVKGEDRLGRLIEKLYADGRTVDALRVSTDKKVRKICYKKYGMWDKS